MMKLILLIVLLLLVQALVSCSYTTVNNPTVNIPCPDIDITASTVGSTERYLPETRGVEC